MNGVDVNGEVNDQVMSGAMPFKEHGGQEVLDAALESELLKMTTDISCVSSSKYVIVVVGTPLDGDYRPDLSYLDHCIEEMTAHVRRGLCIILRSTVPPGTTDRVRRQLADITGLTEGRDFTLVYAPERFSQGNTLKEITELPQLIGAYDERGFALVSDFFSTFSSGMNIMLTPVEAELGKIITNTARYVSFALSNEFHLVASRYDGVNINKVIDACNYNYPRLNIPTPGPNVGGPCLHKDGWFLDQEMFRLAFRINESMPSEIVRQLDGYDGIDKVAILGMTFKADSDDVRNSLSFSLLDQLESRGYRCVTIDSHLDDHSNVADLSGCDAVVLMTPHQEFKNMSDIMEAVDNPSCLYLDVWGFWNEMRYRSVHGMWEAKG